MMLVSRRNRQPLKGSETPRPRGRRSRHGFSSPTAGRQPGADARAAEVCLAPAYPGRHRQLKQFCLVWVCQRPSSEAAVQESPLTSNDHKQPHHPKTPPHLVGGARRRSGRDAHAAAIENCVPRHGPRRGGRLARDGPGTARTPGGCWQHSGCC